MKAFRIQELRLRHYRAFSDARLEVGDLTFLVGRNGAGKSTLMDALSFISEALSDSLGTALERRGSLEGIRQRQSGHGTPFEVSVAVRMTWRGKLASFLYGFKLCSEGSNSGYVIDQEILTTGLPEYGFIRDRNSFTCRFPELKPAIDPESLLLPAIAGQEMFWMTVFHELRNLSVHQLSPQAIRSEPKIGSDSRLSRDGGNAGDVLKHTSAEDHAWIEARLGAAVSGIKHVKT